MKNKKGISLITLIIIIVVIIILSVAIILVFREGGMLDNARKAKFMNNFRSVEDGVNLYAMSSIKELENFNYSLPVLEKLTIEEKQQIENNVITLNIKILELNQGKTLDNTELYWIDLEKTGASSLSKDRKYIIDVSTRQIYDYIGEKFEGKRWHTLDGGVEEGNTVPATEGDELWDGWIKLTLYYPAGATEKQWRLGSEGEVRTDSMLMWQDYTGPITIPLDRTKDVWIRYNLNGNEVIIPPAGTLLVDIQLDKTGGTAVDKVKVKIMYDANAKTKLYKVGNSDWLEYTGEFEVSENCLIQAKASKTEEIYNQDGTLLTTRNLTGSDMVYIGNIGVLTPDENLVAPTITRLSASNEIEKARVQVTYPAEAVKKIYKINYVPEVEYTSEISIEKYGTHVIAYYYDINGKRSKASAIKINDTSTGAVEEPPAPYDPNPPGGPLPGNITPDVLKDAPEVLCSPSTIAPETVVSVNAPAEADKIYIKLGRYGKYEEYKSGITIRKNMQVYAYYVTYNGEKSKVGTLRVKNIKQNNMPYIDIDANPYPWSGSYGASKVTVTINYSEADTIEYSEDGIIYKPYIGAFEVTENKIIYARGKNAYGVTEEYLDITNIGNLSAPKQETKLLVSINVNPEPLITQNRVAKANVTIEYDAKATEKYYTIGKYGVLQPYTGGFEVTSNCTVYAYAKGENAKGSISKKIDNLTTGIAAPEIIALPRNNITASKVNITIEYDKYATIKKYSINGGSLRDYAESFDVTENGTVIYAYSENELGQKSEEKYIVNNVVPEPPSLLIDKGKYYILKLNYPEKSKGREYKWKADGQWTAYKEAGIMLIKPEYKDELIKSGTLIKIEDENGEIVTFTGDYYFIDVSISEFLENISMRWDRTTPMTPQIILNKTEPAKEVIATIVYNSVLIKKQYRILKPGEEIGEWQDYTGPIKIDKNNTTIYAKGMDDAEMWSLEGVKKVTNIDENAPVIKLTADLETATQSLSVRVSVTDDVAVGPVKWAEGLIGESYFTSGGNTILNNSIVKITSNGYYTFYAEDKVGNKQTYTLNVTNIDLTAPKINIQVEPEITVGTASNVTIDYGDSTTKQYKIGESNSTWLTYTNTFALSSYTVLANNLQNVDGTVTVYAKGKDTAGNEVTVQKKIVNLDLDKPQEPVIISKSGYATLASYGVILDTTITIEYDTTRTDIDNYYSIDNGVTWEIYTGSFQLANGNVIAKSVKKSTGLEVSVTKTLAMPSDAIRTEAYDGNDTTYTSISNQYIQVDSSMQDKNVRLYWVPGLYSVMQITYLDENKNVITTTSTSTTGEIVYKIPTGTKWMLFSGAYSVRSKLYEIQPSNEPIFSAINGYMLLHADSTKAIKEPYQMVNISYFATSVQRLYKIGDNGNWANYLDQSVKVKQGETIYAKGIDKYGNETRIITSYIANVIDAISKEVYDGDDTTSMTSNNVYMQVDSSMQGKNIRVYWTAGLYATISLKFLDANKNVITTHSRAGTSTGENIYVIPIGTKWILYVGGSYYTRCKLYEIGLST